MGFTIEGKSWLHIMWIRRVFLLAFVTSILLASTAGPLSAHYTLGDMRATYPYRENDAEPNHVAGPVGYVWPGAGLSMYIDQWRRHIPGYQSPTTSPLLLENHYSPWASILASTEDRQNVGDLIFAVNFTKDPNWPSIDYRYDDVLIYIPPEFQLLVNDKSCVSTTISNHYGHISLGTSDSLDPFAPNWRYIKIKGNIDFLGQHSYKEWYYVRVNSVVAPRIFGRYFFKIFLNQTYPNRSGAMYYTVPVENYPVLLVKGEVDPAIITGTIRYGAWNQTLYKQPIQLPGRLRAVGVAEDPYTGQPIGRKVEARGYFNSSVNGYFEVEGLAPGIYDLYASAAGYPEVKVASSIKLLYGKSFHLDVYLNPGIVIHGQIFSKHGYGETPWLSQRPIRVEIYAAPQQQTRQPINEAALTSWSPINQTHIPYTSYVHGNPVWLDGPPNPKLTAFPWEGPSPDKELNGVYNGVGPAQYWWVDPAGQYTNGGGSTSFIFRFGIKGRYGAPTEFDGHVPQVFATWVNGLEPGIYYLRAWINGYVQTDASGRFAEYSFAVAEQEWAGDIYIPMDLQASSWINKTVHFHDIPSAVVDQPVRGPDPGRYLIVEVRDRQGSLVAFNFTYVYAQNSSRSVALTGLGMAGPNLYPTNGGVGNQGMKYFLYRHRHIRDYGITPGTYALHVYMRGYIQQSFEEVTVSLSTSQIEVSNRMHRGAGINVTLYSVDWQRPRIDRSWTWPQKTVTLTVYDKDGLNLGNVRYWAGSWWKHPKQASGQTSIPNPTWSTEHSKLKFNGSVILERSGPAGALETSPYYPDALVATGWSPYLDSGFINEEHKYRRADLSSKVALETGTYVVKAFTYGYVQKEVVTAFASEGGQGDASLKLITGANFTTTVIFKTQRLISPTPYNMSARIRVYDEENNLIAASTTSHPAKAFHYSNGVLSNHPSFTGEEVDYVPAGTLTLNWLTAGLDSYSDPVTVINATYGVDGAPSYRGNWTVEIGFVNWYRPDSWYPPPPGLLLGEYNLDTYTYLYNHLGPYEMRQVISIPSVHMGGEASIQFEVDQRGLIRGVVSAFTWCNELRTVSWATVEAVGERGEFTTYTLDGLYEAYLPPGTYDLTLYEWSLEGEGHTVHRRVVAISEGQTAEGINIVLETSRISIPEFKSNIILALALVILTAAMYVKVNRHEKPRSFKVSAR